METNYCISPPNPLKGVPAPSIVKAYKRRKSPSGDLGVIKKKNTTLIHSYKFINKT